MKGLNEWMQQNQIKKAQEFFSNKMAYTIGPIELDEEIKSNLSNINIIDVRKPEHYKRGHIPKAKNLSKNLWQSLSNLRKDKMNIIYGYSPECHLAAEAAVQFSKEGFHVMELDGGFSTWQEHNLETED